MSRTVNGEWLLDATAKEVLRRQIWQVADFCGVEVITYAVMSNHFHVVACVPLTTPVSDGELLRRYRTLYPKPTRYQAARLDAIERQLAVNGPEAIKWRQRQLRLMGDISQYMKLVKQRFSTWFNRSHDRFGTLWAERFKSVLVGPGALEATVAYIDLNSVRAGLTADPKDYRFSGYAEAVAGNAAAQSGLRRALGGTDWASTHRNYRELLFGIGASPRATRASVSPAAAQRVFHARGELPMATLLRCRIRYFTEGAILGTASFVEAHLQRYRARIGRMLRNSPHPVRGCSEWDSLATLRKVRSPAIV